MNCIVCNKEITGMSKYCSNACSQKAYRNRLNALQRYDNTGKKLSIHDVADILNFYTEPSYLEEILTSDNRLALFNYIFAKSGMKLVRSERDGCQVDIMPSLF